MITCIDCDVCRDIPSWRKPERSVFYCLHPFWKKRKSPSIGSRSYYLAHDAAPKQPPGYCPRQPDLTNSAE